MSAADSGSARSGPRAFPLVGHLPGFLWDKLEFLSRCAAEYGDVVKLKIGTPTFLLSNPDDIRHVFSANAYNYDKTTRMTSARGKRLSGEGLLTSSGRAHMEQRRMMRPVFHRKAMEDFAALIVQNTERMLAAWTTGAELNVSQATMDLAQRNIIGVIFGTGVDDAFDELVEAVNIRRRYMEHVFFAPVPEWVPSSIGFKYRNAMPRLHRIIHRAIQQRRLHRAHDLLSLLIDAKYDDGSAMTDRQVYDEARMLLVTGYETIGEALGWTWHVLGQHPAIDAKLSSELQSVLDGRLPGAEDLPKLEYSAMILAESMRLYPPTWITVRVAREEDRLPSGARIPAGAKVYLCQYVTHRKPQYWPQPDRFDPDRFTEAGRKDRPPFAYFPFGGGARHCIGEPLARMQGALVLATVGRRFSLRSVPSHPVVVEPKMTLRPRNGIRMRVERR